MAGGAQLQFDDVALDTIADALLEGRIVPFLGAGFNLSDRPAGAQWEAGKSTFLPSGGELARHLADKYRYPSADRELPRICQYVVETRGSAPLYDYLRSLFAGPCDPGAAHAFLAGLPARLKALNGISPYQLIVTTNYDDLIERAFAARNEPLDVVSYMADSRTATGKFSHHLPDGSRRVIDRPNEYREISVKRSPVLLKIHGDFDRAQPENDSFVITEDHYIDFLTRTDLSNLVPVTLAAQLRSSHFVFLGYSLRDWNLRVILHRIWEEQRLTYASWAVQNVVDPLDLRFWTRRNVEIIRTDLGVFLEALGARIDKLGGK